MRIIRGGRLRRLALVMSLGVLAALAIAGATSARVDYGSSDSPSLVWLEGQPESVTFCHVAGPRTTQYRHSQCGTRPSSGRPVTSTRTARQGRTRAGLPRTCQRHHRPSTCVRTSRVTRQPCPRAWSKTSRGTGSRPPPASDGRVDSEHRRQFTEATAHCRLGMVKDGQGERCHAAGRLRRTCAEHRRQYSSPRFRTRGSEGRPVVFGNVAARHRLGRLRRTCVRTSRAIRPRFRLGW